MSKLLRTWYPIDGDAHYGFKVEYWEDKILNHTPYANAPINCPFASIFYTPYCIGDYYTDCHVSEYVAKNHPFDPTLLSAKEEKNWRFWKYLNLEKLPTLVCYSSNDSKYFLELSPDGLRDGMHFDTANSSSIKHYKNYRLNDLFFMGPKMAGLTLDDRKSLQIALLNALDPLAGFSLKDVFPLFDYNKIPTKRWEFYENFGLEGLYAELNGNTLKLGGWKERDGSSIDYSIEEIWSRRPEFADTSLNANQELETILSNAIIQEN